MSRQVLICVSGTQQAPGNVPETVELTTVGTLRVQNGVFRIAYEESALTGLEGTVTTFHVTPERIVLCRAGSVESRMEFVEGQVTESLYGVEGGALLLQVHARRMAVEMSAEGGSFDLYYDVRIDDVPAGTINYHITVRAL